MWCYMLQGEGVKYPFMTRHCDYDCVHGIIFNLVTLGTSEELETCESSLLAVIEGSTVVKIY
jgi:hypothetical protein